MSVRTCGHCGQECWMNEAGFASWNGVPVCNPETGTGRMECYRLVKEFNHEIPCLVCRRVVKEGGSLGTEDNWHLQRTVDAHGH